MPYMFRQRRGQQRVENGVQTPLVARRSGGTAIREQLPNDGNSGRRRCRGNDWSGWERHVGIDRYGVEADMLREESGDEEQNGVLDCMLVLLVSSVVHTAR